MATIFHLPLVLGATPSSTPAPQTALGQASSVPSLIALFHSGVYIGLPDRMPWVTRSPQNRATLFVDESLMLTVQVPPSLTHQFAPACSASPANQPGSPEENVARYWLGAFCRTWRGVAAKSSHVFGTCSPNCVKRSSR